MRNNLLYTSKHCKVDSTLESATHKHRDLEYCSLYTPTRLRLETGACFGFIDFHIRSSVCIAEQVITCLLGHRQQVVDTSIAPHRRAIGLIHPAVLLSWRIAACVARWCEVRYPLIALRSCATGWVCHPQEQAAEL